MMFYFSTENRGMKDNYDEIKSIKSISITIFTDEITSEV
jgi:hypothetical protein